MPDFSTYKFRCSSLPALMTTSRYKGDVLSETAKEYLREVWIKEVYGREKYDTKNKFTDKGIQCESDSFNLIKEVSGKTYFKNLKELENEFITGTPDLVKPLIDIKTSWDIFTFAKADENYARKAYYYQLLGYMWLTGQTKGELTFCLVNTPPEIIDSEIYKLSFKMPEIGESDEATNKVKRNYLFDDIPAKDRIKSFSFDINEEDIAAVKEKIVYAREYLKGLSL